MSDCPHRKCTPGKWAHCATCPTHKGLLHEFLHDHLGVPMGVKVTQFPWRGLLNRIKGTPTGQRIHHGHRSVVVDQKLKSRVNFALNMNPVL